MIEQPYRIEPRVDGSSGTLHEIGAVIGELREGHSYL
jgi:hypothetical protein